MNIIPDSHDKRVLVPIVQDELYFWIENAPYVGLDLLSNLDLEEKKQAFGLCQIDRYIAAQSPDITVVFNGYLELDFLSFDPQPKKIFFPGGFLAYCESYRQHAGSDWKWKDHRRTVSVVVPMNKLRYPRALVSCWLANHGHRTTFLHTQSWEAQDHCDLLTELLQLGNLRDWTGSWGSEVKMLPKNYIDTTGNNAITLFDSLIEPVYLPAASCVVISGTFWEYGCEVCEKYIFAVYGGCIPLVHGYKIYDRLRDLGFDVFDDVIDTSSQYEKNPVIAAWNLMDKNRYFLTHAIDIWQDPMIQKRLHHNLELMKDVGKLYQNSLQNLNTAANLEMYHRHKKDIWTCYNRINGPCPRVDFSIYDNQLNNQ